MEKTSSPISQLAQDLCQELLTSRKNQTMPNVILGPFRERIPPTLAGTNRFAYEAYGFIYAQDVNCPSVIRVIKKATLALVCTLRCNDASQPIEVDYVSPEGKEVYSH